MKNKYNLAIFSIIFASFFITNAFSNEKQDILNKLAAGINQNNFGTEFCLSIPPALSELVYNPNNTIKIYAFALYDSKVKISILNKNYSDEKSVKSGELIEFTLSPELAQPYLKTAENQPVVSDIYQRSAIQISSDSPVSIYSLIMYNSSVEGFLVYPISKLSKSYLISTYKDPVFYYPIFNSLPAIITIVSPFDENKVTFDMGGNANTLSSDGLKPGDNLSRVLNKGDVWVISTKGRESDLSGSSVKSDLPIGVVSANQYSNIPIGNKSGNYTVEMETPINTWGKTYLAGRFFNRKTSPIIRVYAKEANTNVYVNNYPAGTIKDAFGTENNAFLELRLSDFVSDDFYAISSEKPINVVLYNTGTEEDGLPTPLGGPFKVVLTPVEQYQQTSMFSLPYTSLNDFASHYLSIFTELDESQQIPDSLELIKFKLNTELIFKVKNLKHLIRKDLLNINGKNYSYIAVQIQTDGSYAIRSNKSFYSISYGFKNNLVYGFLPSINLKNLSSDDALAPVVKWDILCNGIIEGQTEDVAEAGTLASNLSGHLFMSNESENISVIEIDKIIPGITKKIDWKLKVIDMNKTAKAKIKFWDAASNQIDATIIYKPSELAFEVNYVYFGSFKSSEFVENDLKIINNSDEDIYIGSFSLKWGNKGFSILNNSNVTIPTKKFALVKLKFDAGDDGIKVDSLGFVDTCGVTYKVKLEANVGSPVIDVSDVYFGDVIIGTTKTLTSMIKNTGASKLVINGFNLPKSNAIQVDFKRTINPGNPLQVEPGASFEFDVSFLPTNDQFVTDSVILISDAPTKDNIAIINGRGIQPGLMASSYDWGRQRIHRSEFPAGPYPALNPASGIVIQNQGSKDLRIAKVEIKNEINPDAFELNVLQLNNKELKSGESMVLQTAFRPNKLGVSKLLIELTDENGNKTQTQLLGFGIVPKLRHSELDFDTVVSENYQEPSILELEISNLPEEDWVYADTVNIFDIFSENTGDISDQWFKYGSKGFKFDKSKINFPIKLAPGQSYFLPVAFAASSGEQFSANLKIVSDAIEYPSIKLKGFGIEQSLSVSDGSAETCTNTPVQISSIIKNNGNTDIQVSPIKFIEPQSEFSFVEDKDISDGFTLLPNQDKEIKVLFRPVSPVTKTVEILIEAVDNQNLRKVGSITGISKSYFISSFLKPIEQTLQVGSVAKISINLESSLFNENTIIKEFSFIIKFNSKILKPLPDEFNDGSIIKGKFYREISFIGADKMKITFKSLTNDGINQSCELIELAFQTYYPNDALSYSNIEAISESVDNNCVAIKKSLGRINIEEQCIGNLRQFTYNGNKYNLGKVNPNPVSNDEFKISFGIGISATTVITITNSLGEVILKPIDSSLEKGTYEISIPTVNLGSGLYFISIKSGPFTANEKLIISK